MSHDTLDWMSIYDTTLARYPEILKVHGGDDCVLRAISPLQKASLDSIREWMEAR
jgi:hypothetical protein